MADENPTPEDIPSKKSKMPMIIGLLLAVIGGGGGFYATWSGAILSPDENAQKASSESLEIQDSLGDIAFVPVEPMTVSVDPQSENRLLRFRAQLEVPKAYEDDVTKLLPRVVDVLNSYLRALEVADLENQAALTRLRAQMLRRVQVVTGPERVSDFLIMEFVLT